MLKFISLVLVIVVMMVFGNKNLLAAEANDAEMHYFRGIEYYMHKQYYDATLEFGQAIRLKRNYTDAESALKVAYAKLKENDSEANIASQHEKGEIYYDYGCLYGCLGAYQGVIFGFISGCFAVAAASSIMEDEDLFIPMIIGGATLGGAAGAYLGSQADTWEEKRSVIISTVIATTFAGLVVLFVSSISYPFQ